MLIAESIYEFRILTESVRREHEVITQEKTHRKGSTHMETQSGRIWLHAVAYRGGFGVFNPPPRNSEDIGGVLDRISKKNRRLDFLL